jgi:hypothetical protein
MMRRLILFSGLILFGLTAGKAGAEVSVRECILEAPSTQTNPYQSYVVPASSTVTFSSFQFNLYTASHAVFEAQVFFHDSSQPVGQRVRYDILVDGSTTGRLTTPTLYYNRTPWISQGSTTVRAFYQNLAAGDHTVSLTINNTSTNDLLVFGVFMNSLFVDNSEASASYFNTSTQTVGSTYSTIGQLTIPSAANRSMFVSSYIRATAPGVVNFRYLVNGVQDETVTTNFRNSDNGTLIETILPNAVPGQVVQLQASGTATVSVVEMAGQELQQYTLMSTTSDTGGSVSGSLVELQIAKTSDIKLNPLSLSGPHDMNDNAYTCHWGTNDTVLSMSASKEVLMILRDIYDGMVIMDYDAGIVAHSPDATPATYHQISDFVCGAGTSLTATHALRLGLLDLCSGTPNTMTYGHQRMQYFVLPAPCPPGVPGPYCNKQGWPTSSQQHVCTSEEPGCPYACQITPGIALQSIPAPNPCN